MLARRSLLRLSAAGLGVGRTAAAQSESARISEVWAGLQLVDTAGRSFRLADLPQPLKLVKLWAHWCAGCLAGLPALAALAKTIGAENAHIVLVSHADDWRRDQLAAERLQLPFRLAT